jgi:hypothetical protein
MIYQQVRVALRGLSCVAVDAFSLLHPIPRENSQDRPRSASLLAEDDAVTHVAVMSTITDVYPVLLYSTANKQNTTGDFKRKISCCMGQF